MKGKGDDIMAGLARSPRGNRTTVVRVKDKKQFIKDFNSRVPPKEKMEEIRNVGDFFGIGTKKS